MSLATLNDPLPSLSCAPYVGRLADEVLSRYGKSSPGFNGDGLQLLERLLDFAANAEQQLAQQRQQIRALEELTRTDALTGMLNRRGFEEAMTSLLGTAQRYNEEGVICFIDLDGFKQVNDTYGHHAGDQVLCEVAAALSDNVRSNDLVARIGGDEFIVVLSRTTLSNGLKNARRLQRLLDSMVVTTDMGQAIDTSASIGIHCYGPDTELRRVMQEADSAMYAEKARRRDGGGNLVAINTEVSAG